MQMLLAFDNNTNTHRTSLTDYVNRCNKKPNTTIPGCDGGEQELYESSGYCGILLDKKGPFAVCHPRVNPNVIAPTFTRHTHTNVYTTHKYEAVLTSKGFDVVRILV